MTSIKEVSVLTEEVVVNEEEEDQEESQLVKESEIEIQIPDKTESRIIDKESEVSLIESKQD